MRSAPLPDRSPPTMETRTSSPPAQIAGAPSAQAGRDLGILALVVLGPIWGYGWVATKVALGYSQPLTFAALRVVLTALCLFFVLIATRRSLRPPPLGYTTVIGLLQITAFVGLVIVELHSAAPGKVAVLTYTMPFWLLLLAWAFLGERPGRQSHAAAAPRGRALAHHLADDHRLAAADPHRRTHVQRRARLDGGVRLGPRLHGG